MWVNVALAIIVLLLVAIGMVLGPFLTLRRIPPTGERGGMAVVKDGFVTIGVIPLGEHAVALVDAGKDAGGKALLGELARRGYGPDDVKTILLTHGHWDHIAAVRKFPKAEVLALAKEVEVVEGRSMGGAPLFKFVTPRPTGIHVTRTLKDGDSLPLGPYTVRVFAVPGHTPGSAAYAIGENLFLGDAANHGRNGRLKPGPGIFNGDSQQNRHSLQELARRVANDSSIKTLIFSHSAAMERGVELLAEFANRA